MAVPAPSPTIPFSDPVLIVATAMIIFLVVPLLFERLRLPGIVGVIVSGAVIGPNGFGLLARDQTIVLLGTVGLLYLMLLVGLELDLNEFSRYRNRSIVFGTLSFAVPACIGAALALALGYPAASALLVGAAFSSHTLLAYPIASRLGIVRNEAVTTALGGTILTEVLALLLLAVVVNSRGGPMDLAFWARLAVPFTVYVAAVMWGLPKLARWFFRRARADGASEFVFLMVSLFVVSYLAHFGGVEPIVGALLAGLALNRLVPEQSPLMNRVHFVGNAVFIPFFLLSVGMLVDVRALDSPRAWVVSGALALGVIVTKWLAAAVTGRVFGYRMDETWVVFGLSVPHAAGTLAIVLVGFDVGLLDQAEVNGVVLMILATCIVGPWAVDRYGRRVALAGQRDPVAPSSTPRRVLIPLGNPATAQEMLDLALVVRGKGTVEPLRPLMVVAEESQVADAEQLLGYAVLHGAGADVPVVPMTRVDTNVAAGIARGVAESRSGIVLVGWDGQRQGARMIFGSILDQLLDRTRALVVVARVREPLRTTRRVVVVLPPNFERHPALGEALCSANELASGLGGSLLLWVVSGSADGVRELHATIRPHVPASVEPVDGWQALGEKAATLRRDDLVFLLGARRGTLAWTPRLERLPATVGASWPGNLLVAYPPEAAADPDPLESLAEHVVPDRVVQLDEEPYPAAITRLARSAFDPARAEEITRVVLRNEEQFSSELTPGAVLPHVRLRGLAKPVLVLGVSRRGIDFPLASSPAHLVLLLVSPAERAEEHLHLLARLARQLTEPGSMQTTLDQYAPGAALDWLHVRE